MRPLRTFLAITAMAALIFVTGAGNGSKHNAKPSERTGDTQPVSLAKPAQKTQVVELREVTNSPFVVKPNTVSRNTASATAAQTPSFSVPWSSINYGGTVEATSSGHQVGSSVSQTFAGASSSSSYFVGAGFWYTTSVIEPGIVTGRVAADCPVANTGIYGVEVDAYALGTGDLVGFGVTDSIGNYKIDSLFPGDYVVTIVTPLGYSAALDEVGATVPSADTVNLDFALSCVEIVASPRSIGFWKHQVGVALSGRGSAQIDGVSICDYLDLIDEHFNSNQINQVVVYVPPASGLCDDKLQVAKVLLNLKGAATMTARAKQQLTALLLNVAGQKISLTEYISEDSATVSQAITYADSLIDDPGGDHEQAKTICDQINNSKTVAAGVIPLTTPIIGYKTIPNTFSLSQNYPNPFNPTTSFTLSLPEASNYSIRIYNVMGRLVREFEGHLEAGIHTITWDGTNADGRQIGSGVYFYRAQARNFSETRKMMMLK